jgi:hypothetical protein
MAGDGTCTGEWARPAVIDELAAWSAHHDTVRAWLCPGHGTMR